MWKKRLFIIVSAVFFLSACQVQGNGKIQKVTIEKDPSIFKALEVTSPATSLSMTVRHMISNGNVFVECYVPGFEFTEASSQNKQKKGHLRISVDHQKPYPVYKAAFIIKDLPKGTHHIAVTLIDAKGEAIEGLNKEITVTIS
ncbi:hypothetical protein [Pseudalkalibacillus salsuginis]|uniref:hypothetical protein n=1 Tax=Pseudalkalibacillus salsuginis TaxID=2910972 RepID=UPI001F43639E|nr:hypothetical protein [Pseudalkalibacillus salsuginis]MCF6410440.1 hypothetical protein [Pseudalkalibacillus salsuginis]